MENMVLTHNHPSENIFSDADLFTGFKKTKLAELRTVTPDGTIYSLTPTEEARLPKLLVEYTQMEHKAERLFREMLDRKYRAGIITAEEKTRALYYDFNKYCNEKLITMFRDKAREFGFNFKEYKRYD